MFKAMDILDIHSRYDQFINAKNHIDKQLVFQNDPVDRKWMIISGEPESNSYKSKHLLLLVSKILGVPCSDTLV